MKNEIYLEYEYNTYGGDICVGDEDSEWPNHEPKYTEFQILNAFRSSKNLNWAETVEVSFDPEKTDLVHVLIVRYSTGDTFGTSYGEWYIVGAYDNNEQAQEILKSINNGTYSEYNPWTGYFESLEDVYIEELRLR